MTAVNRYSSISKFFFWTFYIYINWYKEIWGDIPVVLYGSVFCMSFTLILSGKYHNLRLPNILKIFIIFGLYSLIVGIIVSSDTSKLISDLITYFAYIIVLINCIVISKVEGNCYWLLKPMIFVAFLCSIKAVFMGYEMMNGGAIAITMGKDNNANSLASVCLHGIFALIAREEKIEEFYIVRLGLMGLFIITAIRAGSRKIIISIAFLILIWLLEMIFKSIKHIFNNKSLLILSSIVVIVLLCFWYFHNYYITSDQYTRMMNMLTNEGDTNATRIALYRTAIDIWKTSPIFGVGFNQFSLHSPYGVGYYSHSTYAEVLSCQGIIGCLLLFCPIIFSYLQMIKKTIRSVNSKYNYIMCIAAFSIELFLGIGQIWVYGFSHMFFFVCIFSLFVEKKKQRNNLNLRINYYYK